MKKKNIWLIVASTGLIIVLISALSYSFESFKKDVNLYNQKLELRFDQEHQRMLSSLKVDNPKAFDRFSEGFNRSVAYEKADTSYYFLTAEYEYPSLNYLNCLKSDVEVYLRSELNKELNGKKKAEYVKRFDENGSSVLNQMQQKGVFVEKYSGCAKYFGNREYTVYKESIWSDIEEILVADTQAKVSALIANKEAEENLLKDLKSADHQIRWKYRQEFKEKIKSSIDEILIEEDVQTKTTTKKAGSWVTSTTTKNYHPEKLDEIIGQFISKQWKNNSLKTGAQPYSNCFESQNKCSGYSCSRIEVTAGNRDVITSVKNSSGKVVRHAYINSSSKHTFEVPNGNYRIFFYSGSGWNPKKSIASKTCRSLRGGFVSGESYSKDPESIKLYDKIITYELYEQIDGNFQTSSSSSNEAF